MTRTNSIKVSRFSDYLFWGSLYLFVGIIMIDPANKLLHMKEVAFVLLLLITIISQRGKFYREAVETFFALTLLAFLSICMGVFVYHTDAVSSLPYFKALLFLLVMYPLSILSINQILKFNYIVGLGMSLFISFMLLSYIGGLFDMMNFILMLRDGGAVYIAMRENLGFEMYMFYYATLPYIFLAFIYALRNGHYVSSFFIVATIFYGGSRTPILMAFAVVGYILYDKKKSKFLKLFIGTFVVIALLYIVYLLTSNTYSQEGDDFKFAVANYLLVNSSPVGHGVGAMYWDPGRSSWTNSTEITYIEMLYQYGWFLFPFVLYIFIKPFVKLYKRTNNDNVRDFAIAYFVYLINAGTNPLLISSTGLYVFACTITISAKLKARNCKGIEQI